ncbi:MAG: PQQ-like beta-propeller repeat protein [Deltaproteobacteria bacterium]|nr:PQQ-like beta-propeller repeat protein [Deltaproteobacteria bacterium]
MKQYLILGIFLLLCGLVVSCASNECSDGKCIESVDGPWGVSRVVALEPNSGKFRWLVDSLGETLEFVRLQNNNTEVVVRARDNCFEKNRLGAFLLADANQQVTIQPRDKNEIPPLNLCANASMEGVSSFEYISGFCVGLNSVTGDLIALDSANNTEVWRSALGGYAYNVFGNVLLAHTKFVVDSREYHRVARIGAANGQTLWQIQKPGPIVSLGASDSRVFFLYTQPFAVNAGTGDVAWTYDAIDRFGKRYTFVPETDTGIFIADTLLVFRQALKETECIDTSAHTSSTD